MSRKTWIAIIAVVVVSATMVAGGLVRAAVVSAPPFPPTTGPEVLPPPSVTPPPTVFPPDFWGPRPWPPTPTSLGPGTAGTRITLGGELRIVGNDSKVRTLQLPPNVYVMGMSTQGLIVDCFRLPCAQEPFVTLQVLGGKSVATVDANLTIFMDAVMPPGEEAAFDWLFQALGVAKGSEVRISSVTPGGVQ